MSIPPGSSIRTRALLFDMDGTLLDSQAVTDRVNGRWAARHGVDPARMHALSHGRRTIDTITELAVPGLDPAIEAAGIEEEERLDVLGIVPIPGILELLRALPPDRWAVVTSADRALATIRLRAAGITPPPVLITADDVTIGKPDPQGYLLAAARLGFPPADCLVLEDAPAGLEAGRRAGMRRLALATAPSPDWPADQGWISDYLGITVNAEADGRLVLAFAG